MSAKSSEFKAFTYYTGDYYDGQWCDDVRHGFGVYLYATGDAYAGNWKDNRRHGWGTQLRPNNIDQYIGEWQRDMRSGLGCLYQRNGSRYVGGFLEDCRHGVGITIKRNGMIYRETYSRGQLGFRKPLLYVAIAETSGNSDFNPFHMDGDDTAYHAFSTVFSIPQWSVEDVQVLLEYSGFSYTTRASFRTHAINGVALLSIFSEYLQSAGAIGVQSGACDASESSPSPAISPVVAPDVSKHNTAVKHSIVSKIKSWFVGK